jgi:hypothetical protein
MVRNLHGDSGSAGQQLHCVRRVYTRAVSELVGNDEQQPNAWSECFYLRTKRETQLEEEENKVKYFEKKKKQKKQPNDKCSHHLHKTTVRKISPGGFMVEHLFLSS